ncbi:MAG TPA: hypothetical protein VGF20_08180 [Candidatus Acidoferrum sp.]
MSVYDQVLGVSKVYLGPAAETFIGRQCKYLKVEPKELAVTHMEKLAWLTKSAAGLVMHEAKAAELAQKIGALK